MIKLNFTNKVKFYRYCFAIKKREFYLIVIEMKLNKIDNFLNFKIKFQNIKLKIHSIKFSQI